MIVATSEQNQKDLINEIDFSDENILYLGQWCKSLEDKDFFNLKKVIEYHWSNTDKREKDLKYIEILYEKILIEFTTIFNDLFDIGFTKKETEIFYGLWLKTYLIVSFDRWEIIDDLLKKNLKYDLYFKKIDSFKLANVDEFIFNSIQSDDWNDYFIQKIIKFRSSKFISINYFTKKRDLKFINSERLSSKKNFYKLLDFIFHKIFRFKDNINFSYLDINNFEYFKLILKCKNFSSFDRELNAEAKHFYDLNLRKKLKLKIDNATPFEDFICKNIFFDIPSCFLESFNHIYNFVKKYLEQKNKLFVTTHGYANREEFQLLVSLSKKKYRSSLYIIQHGSGALPKYNTELNFSEKISEKFLRSGNYNFNKSNHKAFGQIFFENFEYNKDSKNISLLFSGLPRRTLYMRSIPLSSDLKEYFEDQIDFINSLDKKTYQNLYIKFYPNNYWNEKVFFSEYFKDLHYYNQKSKIKNISGKTKLFINTSTFTPHNQLIASNIPCIFFWDKKKWFLDEEDEKFHQDVLLNKIYFNSSAEVSKFINKNYEHIFDWWNSDDIKKIVHEYKLRYAYPLRNKANSLYKIIKKF